VLLLVRIVTTRAVRPHEIDAELRASLRALGRAPAAVLAA
jgi:hypothetical protein